MPRNLAKANQRTRRKQPRKSVPHPNKGGARGYPVYHRQTQLNNAAEDKEVTASARTLRRWKKRIEPYAMTGNKDQHGYPAEVLMEIALYRLAFSKANLDEVRTHLYAQFGGVDGEGENYPYSRQQISHIECNVLGLTSKRASTTAYAAFLPLNLAKRIAYWTLPPP